MDDKGVKHIIRFLQRNCQCVLSKSQYEQLTYLKKVEYYGVQTLRKVFSIAISAGAYPECPFCKKPIYTVDELTIDHTIPRSKGGTDDIKNLQPMHGKCNFEKGCTMPNQPDSETQLLPKKNQKKRRAYKRPLRDESVNGHDVDDLNRKCKRIDEFHGCRYSIVRRGKAR